MSADGSPAMDTLVLIATEMRRAAAKHGDNYMANITNRPDHQGLLIAAAELGRRARKICNTDPEPGPMAVLLEEVGELADAILEGKPVKEEATHTAAMATALLEGVIA